MSSENWFVQHPEVMRYILEHEKHSDSNEEEITLRVKCPECQQSHTMVICKESLGNYADNGDGTYTDIEEPFCASCLESAAQWPDHNE